MTADKTAGYITMGQAAKSLRIEGRFAAVKVRRLLVSKQRQCRQKLIWSRGTGKGRRHYTTEAAMRRCMPELFDQTDEVTKQLRSLFRDINRRVSGLAAEVAEMRAVNKRLVEAYGRRFGTLQVNASERE